MWNMLNIKDVWQATSDKKKKKKEIQKKKKLLDFCYMFRTTSISTHNKALAVRHQLS